MKETPITGLSETILQKIKEIADANTVIGNPIRTDDGTTIIPISKITYGFASGGSEFCAKKEGGDLPFGGGSGAGVTVTPLAFLVISPNSNCKILHLKEETTAVTKLVDMVPELVDKIQQLIGKKETGN